MLEENFREGSKRDLYNLYDTSKEESDDIIHDKRLIEKVLLSDHDIIKLLHNTELEEQIENDEADITDYLYTNIYPFLYLPDAQDTTRNFVCFDVEDIGTIDYLEREFGWLNDSGIYLDQARIVDEDDAEDKELVELIDKIF